MDLFAARIQALLRGHLVRCVRSELMAGHSKWYSCQEYSEGQRFSTIYHEFLFRAVTGDIGVFVGFCECVKFNAGTIIHLLQHKRLVCSHCCDMKTLHVRVMHPCPSLARKSYCDFGTSSEGIKRIRPLPHGNFKQLPPDLQAYLVTFMTLKDYWAYSLVSRNIFFDGQGMMKHMNKMASLRLGHKPSSLDQALRGYSCLRQPPRPLNDWLTVFASSTGTSIVGAWPDHRCCSKAECLLFVTKDGRIGKTDLCYGNTQYHRVFRDPYNGVLSVHCSNKTVALRREWGFSVLCAGWDSLPSARWLTVRAQNVHELALVGDRQIFFVAGSLRRLFSYNCETRDWAELPHERVQMLKATRSGVLCRVATKRMVYHCDDYVRAGFTWGAEISFQGCGRIAMVSEVMPSGNNVVIRAVAGAAVLAVVIRDRLVLRTVHLSWTPWFRRELGVVGDMLTFHDKETHNRLCVRPDDDEWVPKPMCVGNTDGQLMFCKDKTVFFPDGKKVCVLPRWA